MHAPHSFGPWQRGWPCPQSPAVANALGALMRAGAALHTGQWHHIPCTIPRLQGAQGRGNAAARGGAVRFTPFSVVHYFCLEVQVLHWENEEEISAHPTTHKGLAASRGGHMPRVGAFLQRPSQLLGPQISTPTRSLQSSKGQAARRAPGVSSRHLRSQPCRLWAGPGRRLQGGGAVGWRTAPPCGTASPGCRDTVRGCSGTPSRE